MSDRKKIYFIGVTTGSSLIMKAFPVWMEKLGQRDTVIEGIDISPHSEPGIYRQAVERIKTEENAVGALVTTHKLDLFAACRDMFDFVDPYAEALSEVSCISKSSAGLCAHAKDPISAGMALRDIVPDGFWDEQEGEALIFGAGGAALAICLYLEKTYRGSRRLRITLSNKSRPRLGAAEAKLSGINPNVELRCVLSPEPGDNDSLVRSLRGPALIVNATGLGKDLPGSPITDSCVFPSGSLIWELNYRGDLLFLRQADAQRGRGGLTVVDGWNYFVYGWTQVISEALHIKIDDVQLRELSAAARSVWKV